jgi:hypothetical protein
VHRGTSARLTIDIDLATEPNRAQLRPTQASADMIGGDVTGSAGDRDTHPAPSVGWGQRSIPTASRHARPPTALIDQEALSNDLPLSV